MDKELVAAGPDAPCPICNTYSNPSSRLLDPTGFVVYNYKCKKCKTHWERVDQA